MPMKILLNILLTPNVKMKIKSVNVIRDPWVTKELMTSSVTDGKLP